MSRSRSRKKPPPRPAVRPTPLFLTLNSANVPGGLGAVPRDTPVEAGSLIWEPADAAALGAPIGYALAVEIAASHSEPEEAVVE